ncbi:hypothetical protein PHSY_006686 [Pseudozyma hubeiensis SY62]|uniref:Uncharacterized protein n=1 Tax=Pseudozyma hubeiensis (strain SY62) TaxID=1305764 RepID=R9PCK2_PSEHS|nr:hypothetical protein PHSY_006686 [Pseudozyma hubeiensis SY62]GAC99089.1 hypothetical protein PHSY_006686 [Pseudozyma hubeiensis SY62]
MERGQRGWSLVCCAEGYVADSKVASLGLDLTWQKRSQKREEMGNSPNNYKLKRHNIEDRGSTENGFSHLPPTAKRTLKRRHNR